MRRLWALLAGNRDYRLLVSANVVSSTGDWILRTGLTYQIYALTGSTTASAAAVLAALLPHIALGSMAGVYVDRWERRRTIIVANLLLGAGLLPLLFVRGPGTAWIIYLVLATQSCLALFFATAEAALVPSLVPEKDLVTANSINGQARDVARLTGAALGGVVVALGGIALLTIVDVVTFAVAAALLASMRRPGASAPVRARRRHLLREWADGLRIVRSS